MPKSSDIPSDQNAVPFSSCFSYQAFGTFQHSEAGRCCGWRADAYSVGATKQTGDQRLVRVHPALHLVA